MQSLVTITNDKNTVSVFALVCREILPYFDLILIFQPKHLAKRT